MTPDELIQNRKPDWERLSAMLQRAQRRQLASLSEAELIEFGRLYRAATSDLAIAQRDFPRHNLAVYLNQMVGRAHPFIYRGEPIIWRRLRDFYARGFPALYREVAPFIGMAALLFFGTGFLFYFVTLANPDAATYVLSPRLIGYIQTGHLWFKDKNAGGVHP